MTNLELMRVARVVRGTHLQDRSNEQNQQLKQFLAVEFADAFELKDSKRATFIAACEDARVRL